MPRRRAHDLLVFAGLVPQRAQIVRNVKPPRSSPSGRTRRALSRQPEQHLVPHDNDCAVRLVRHVVVDRSRCLRSSARPTVTPLVNPTRFAFPFGRVARVRRVGNDVVVHLRGVERWSIGLAARVRFIGVTELVGYDVRAPAHPLELQVGGSLSAVDWDGRIASFHSSRIVFRDDADAVDFAIPCEGLDVCFRPSVFATLPPLGSTRLTICRRRSQRPGIVAGRKWPSLLGPHEARLERHPRPGAHPERDP